jgi:hypothetical protein
MQVKDTTTLDELKKFLSKYKQHDKPPMECSFCGASLNRTSKQLKDNLYKQKPGYKNSLKYFCHITCSNKDKDRAPKEISCTNCQKSFLKKTNQIKKSENHFCTRSCAAIHFNKNKKHGYRRSKIEIYIEEQIKKHYRNIIVIPNDVDTIGLELDLYFPQLNFAIEFNGVFHYEPIYGQNKLEKTQNNDQRKMISCYERGIELCVLDTSGVKHCTQKSKDFFWEIVNNILEGISCRAI